MKIYRKFLQYKFIIQNQSVTCSHIYILYTIYYICVCVYVYRYVVLSILIKFRNFLRRVLVTWWAVNGFSDVEKYEVKNPIVHCLGFTGEKKEKDRKQNDTCAVHAHTTIYNIFICVYICFNGCQSPIKRDCVKFTRQVYSSGETFFHPLIAA